MHPPDRPEPPDPRAAATIADLLDCLRRLRAWAGMPTYREIAERVARQSPSSPGHLAVRPAISTIADTFTKTDRARLDYDLFFALVRALDRSVERTCWWHEAWQAVFAPAAGSVVAARGSLPEPTPGFTGRSQELGRLLGAGREGAAGRSAQDDGAGGGRDAGPAAQRIIGPPTAVISGMAGVGKTTLAVHAGWESHRRSPGLTLHVDLTGFHPSLPPADPAAVLAAFIRLLAGPGARVPGGSPARTLMYRKLLGGRSGVILLDNAGSLEQVIPLLPESATIRTFVTSRVRLPVPSARHVDLSALPARDSVRLLARLTDPGRVAADPGGALDIAGYCGHLPLALSLVARHVNARPHWTLADHAARLGGLGLDDGVRAALALSYRSLGDVEAVLFRLLSIHPGVDFDGYAAAALLGVDAASGTAALTALFEASLIQAQSPGPGPRYRMHDLVRAFARERAVDDDAASSRQAATRRLADYYLASAAAAMDSYIPVDTSPRPAVVSFSSVPPFADPGAALAWLEAERENLVAVAAESPDLPSYINTLSAVLFRYLDKVGHYDAAIRLHQLAAAEVETDGTGDPGPVNRLGIALMRKGNHQEAARQLRRAVDLARDRDDRHTLRSCLGNLGIVYERIGRYRDAAAMHAEALGLADSDIVRARALLNLGIVEHRSGRPAAAVEPLDEALALSRKLGDAVGEQSALIGLAMVRTELGAFDAALALNEEARRLAQATGDRSSAAFVATGFGTAYQRLGRPDEAVAQHEQALALAREIGDATVELLALNGLGEVLTGLGRAEEAAARHHAALELAEAYGDRLETARAHAGLAAALRLAGEPKDAAGHEEAARLLFEELELDPVTRRAASGS